MVALLEDFEFVPSRMNPALKRLWCDRLESGAFPQGRGTLRLQDPDTHQDCWCVLGVLADISALVSWVPVAQDEIHERGTLGAQIGDKSPECFELPSALMEEAHLNWDVASALSYASDEHVPFRVMSEFIRTNL